MDETTVDQDAFSKDDRFQEASMYAYVQKHTCAALWCTTCTGQNETQFHCRRYPLFARGSGEQLIGIFALVKSCGLHMARRFRNDADAKFAMRQEKSIVWGRFNLDQEDVGSKKSLKKSPADVCIDLRRSFASIWIRRNTTRKTKWMKLIRNESLNSVQCTNVNTFACVRCVCLLQWNSCRKLQIDLFPTDSYVDQSSLLGGIIIYKDLAM